MHDLALLSNATATFEEISETGSPAAPLNFPDPNLGRAARVTAVVYNPNTGEESPQPNVIYRSIRDGSANPSLPNRAYLIGRKLKAAIYGCVRACTILRMRDVEREIWEITEVMAAVKIMDWNSVRSMRGRHMEDPIKEVACMQYISRDGQQPHANVMGTLDVLADDQYLYSFMPFCTSGEMFGHVERDGRFSEPLARYWFRQIVNGLYHLQRVGVCHRDLSLENILVDQHSRCVVIDMGMCLRVPYAADDGTVTDVSAGTLRHLILPQGQCGKPNYISPEVLANTDAFDGFAIDLWAAGVILFIMLVGLPPFEWACEQDPRFKMITRGGLTGMLAQWGRTISDDAADLLQNMLRQNPSDRLSLTEVMDHRWLTNEDVTPPTPPQNEEWRNN